MVHRYFLASQDRLVGPFVRRNDGNTYVIDELFSAGARYTLMLPRVMMLARTHLLTYRMVSPDVREYVRFFLSLYANFARLFPQFSLFITLILSLSVDNSDSTNPTTNN